MKRITMTTGAATLVGVLLLAACSPGSGVHASSTRADGALGSISQAGKVGGAAARAPEASAGGAVDAPAPAAKAASLLSPSALIRTAALSVEIANAQSVSAQADQAVQIVTSAGGQVYADVRTGGKAPTATLTLKVPGAALVSTLGTLSALGKELARQTSTQDVTTEVADVTSRTASARASIERLRLLFAQATKIGDVIALESELSQREADLESLESQQRSLAAQTTMATITLHLSTAAKVATHKKQHPTSGFLGGLRSGWRAFASAASGIATGVGAAVPFLVLVLVLGGAAVLLRRHTRSGPVPAPADPS